MRVPLHDLLSDASVREFAEAYAADVLNDTKPPESVGYVKPYSDLWWNSRRGKVTSSKRLYTVLYGTVAAKNKMLDDLEAELADGFTWPAEAQGAALSWGKDHETQARNLIELMHDVKTYEPGFLCHTDVPILACTPDYAIVGADITGEIKCPYKPENHQKLFLQGLKSNEKYVVQVQGQMLITSSACGWFSSFDPRATHAMRLSRETILPDDEMQTSMLHGCEKIASMLHSGSRFGKGLVTTPTGVRKCF
jgi:hypothetical protein